jgi:uncharacterized protein (DUF1330 family)
MNAYMIVDLDVQDVSALEEYRRRAVPVLQKYGGRVLVRLGTAEVLGCWKDIGRSIA